MTSLTSARMTDLIIPDKDGQNKIEIGKDFYCFDRQTYVKQDVFSKKVRGIIENRVTGSSSVSLMDEVLEKTGTTEELELNFSDWIYKGFRVCSLGEKNYYIPSNVTTFISRSFGLKKGFSVYLCKSVPPFAIVRVKEELKFLCLVYDEDFFQLS